MNILPCNAYTLQGTARATSLGLKQSHVKLKSKSGRFSSYLLLRQKNFTTPLTGPGIAKFHLVRTCATFSPPPIDGDLQDAMVAEGAEFSTEGIALSFGNDEEAVRAAQESVSVFDMSHYGRIRFTGDDMIRFLHNQSTADFESLKIGQGCETVFINSLGRTIDLATAWIMSSSVIVTVSPSTRKILLGLFDRYIFPADKVEVLDITEKTNQLAIIGPKSDELIASLGLGDLVGKPRGTNAHFNFEGTPLTAAVGSSLAESGYQLLLSPETAGSVWNILLDKGVVPIGSRAWEVLRVLQGRPSVGSELTKDHNPMEAGLWHTLSLSKGCYIGQEVIAKQINYDGVRQQLYGVKLEADVGSGAVISHEGKKVGKMTSCVEFAGQFFGLGYIKRQEDASDLSVDVEGVMGTIIEVPFLTRAIN